MKRPSSSSFLLVDGNNIIHAWSDLVEMHRRRRGLAHVELCQRLRQYRDTSDLRVVVVFDGRGNRHEEEREPGGLQIIYTDGGSTADDVIERLVAANAGRYRIIVATNDRAEQNLVDALGAEVWSAETLRAEVDGAEGAWRRYLK